MMNVLVPRTKTEYRNALRRIKELMNASPGTAEGRELETWSVVVADYERRRFPVEPADPADVLRFYMEQNGLSQADLVPYIGGRAKVSEILGGKRSLSKRMILNLCRGLGIPCEALIGDGTETPHRTATSLSGTPIRAFLG